MKQAEHTKTIKFKDLPLDLKKQFVHHLSKNDVDFEQVKDSKYLQAKVKIVEELGGRPVMRTKSRGKGDKQNMFQKHGEKGNHFHKDCVYGEWEHKRMANNAKLDNEVQKKMDHSEKYDKHGNRVMTFEEIRDMLRSDPNQQKSIDKFIRNAKKSKEIFPNEKVPKEEDIYFESDIMNKDYYYKHLANRLGYSRVYSMNAVNQSLNEYGPEERSNLNNKKMRFNI